MTYVMSSNVHGTKNERMENTPAPKKKVLSDEENHLRKLLALVSEKMHERFVNF